jgi:hypothetical protein
MCYLMFLCEQETARQASVSLNLCPILCWVMLRGEHCQWQVCFATCFDPDILADLKAYEGKLLHLKPTSADIAYRLSYRPMACLPIVAHNLHCFTTIVLNFVFTNDESQ